MHHLWRANQLDTKSINRSSGKRFWRGVMIAGIDNTLEVRRLFLDGFDGAPQHSLASTAIVGVGMKESNRILTIPPLIKYDQDNSDD